MDLYEVKAYRSREYLEVDALKATTLSYSKKR